MGFTSVGSLLTDTVKTSANSWTTAVTLTRALNAGQLGILVVAADNSGNTADRHELTHATVTDSVGNEWYNVREWNNNNGAAAAGSAVSIWWCVAQNTLSTSGTITVSFRASITAKAITGWVFDITGGDWIVVEGTGVISDDAADASSIVLSGLTSREYLFVRGIARESASTSFTPTASYTALTAAATSGSTDDTNQGACGEFRIATGTGDTSNPTTSSNDQASIYCALRLVSRAGAAIPHSFTSAALADGTDATSYTTASFSPTAGRTVYVSAWSELAASTPAAPTPSGLGGTWTQKDTVTGSNCRLTMWEVPEPGGGWTPGAITFDFSGVTQLHCMWNVCEVEHSGGVVQAVHAASNTVTLASFAKATNLALVFTKRRTQDMGPGQGWSWVNKRYSFDANEYCHAILYRPDNSDLSADFLSSDNTDNLIIAAEISFATASGTSSLTLGALTSSGAGSTGDGTGSMVLGDITLSGAGGVAVTGAGSISVAALLAAATGHTGVYLTASITLDAIDLLAEGHVPSPTAEDLGEDYSHIAFVLLFEGYNLGVCDTNDWENLAAAWADATGWSYIVPGLRPIGTVEQSAKPFDAEVEMPGMSFSIVDDDDDTIAAILLRESNDEAVVQRFANLTVANLDCETPYVLLRESSNFPETGTVYIGNEEIQYELNDGSGTLTNLTRGIRALFGTETDTEHFASPHRINFNPDDPDVPLHTPVASTAPLQWVGRRVGLFLCVERDGVWTAGPDAECVWAGTIRGIADELEPQEEVGIRLDCESILHRLETRLMRQQFRGYLEEGMYLGADNQGIFTARLVTLDPNAVYEKSIDLVPTDGIYTHQDIAAAIQAALADWFDGSGSDFPTDAYVTLEFAALDNGDFYRFRYQADGPSAIVALEMDPSISRLLGFRDPGRSQVSTRQVVAISTGDSPLIELADPGPGLTEYYVTTANWAPLFAALPTFVKPVDDTLTTETFITVTDAQFEFTPQTSMPLDWEGTEANGFLRIGGRHIVAVKQTGPTTFLHYGALDHRFAPLGISPNDGTDALADAQYDTLGDGTTSGIIVEQVWLEIGHADEIVLRLLASTGTEAYNSDDWDIYPEQMGLGLPLQMLDVPSIRTNIGGDRYVLFVDKPRPFLPLFESIMQVRNLHAFWHRGRLTVKGFGNLDEATIHLTEDNKAIRMMPDQIAPPLGRTLATRTLDYLVNQITLNYDIPFGNRSNAEPNTITLNNFASQTDLERIAPVEIDALGFYDLETLGDPALLDAWGENVAAVALADFGGPLIIFERSFDYSLFVDLYPGLPVLLSDDHVMNPATGIRGIDDLPVTVFRTGRTFLSGVGRVQLLYRPEPVLATPEPEEIVVELLSTGSFATLTGDPDTWDYESGAFDLEADHLYVICITSRPVTGLASDVAETPSVVFTSLDDPMQFVAFEIIGPDPSTTWESGARRMTAFRAMPATTITNGTLTISGAVGPTIGNSNVNAPNDQVYVIADATGVETGDNGANAIVQHKIEAMTGSAATDGAFTTFDDPFEATANGALSFCSNHGGGAVAPGDGWTELADVAHPDGGSLGRLQLQWRPDNDTTPAVTGSATDYFFIALELRARVP